MSSISDRDIQLINRRYSERLLQHGDDPRTLGWSDTNQQQIRFERVCKYTNPSNHSILDIGCGFGDFAHYLQDRCIHPAIYTGVDINHNLLHIARTRQYSFPTTFCCGNILTEGLMSQLPIQTYDYALAVGVFNLNFHNSLSEMTEFLFAMLDRMLQISSKLVVIDYIPNERIDPYKPEDYIATYSSQEIIHALVRRGLKFNLDLLQDPNPMQECLLVVDPSS